MLASSGSSAYDAFLTILKSDYASIGALNTAWSTASWKANFASFDAIGSGLGRGAGGVPVDPTSLSSAGQAELSKLTADFVKTYFSAISGTLRAFDPHHLYLGTKFATYTADVLSQFAQYANVVSFDIYRPVLGTDPFTSANLAITKPMLVAEHSFGAADRGMFWGTYYVGTQTARGASYAAFLDSVVHDPNFVGAHWWELYDEPAVGRPGHGENVNGGFVSVTDAPYTELVTAAQNANVSVYPTLAGMQP